MKRFIRLTAVLLLSLTVLLLASCTPTEDDLSSMFDPSDAVVWEVSEDGKTIVGGGKTYKHITIADKYVFAPTAEHTFYNWVELPFDNYEYVSLSSYAQSGEIIWANGNNGRVRIYATEDGNASLKSFFNSPLKSFHFFEKSNTNYRSYLGMEELDAFEDLRRSGVTARIVNVSVLEDVPCYRISAYDEYEVFRYDCCAIYAYEGELYYLNYLDLDNSYFDADGNFSYRSGQVTLTRLEEHVKETAEALIDGVQYRPYESTYEADDYYEDAYDDYFDNDDDYDEDVYYDSDLFVLFWFAFVLLGFVAPIPFLVLGLTLPRSAKRNYPRYWYSVAVAAAVWFLAAAGLMLLLIL